MHLFAHSLALPRVSWLSSSPSPQRSRDLSEPCRARTGRRWSRMYVAPCSFVFSYTAVKMLIDNCVAPPDHRLALRRVSTATTAAMLSPSRVVTLRVPLRDTSRLSWRVSHPSVHRVSAMILSGPTSSSRLNFPSACATARP